MAAVKTRPLLRGFQITNLGKPPHPKQTNNFNKKSSFFPLKNRGVGSFTHSTRLRSSRAPRFRRKFWSQGAVLDNIPFSCHEGVDRGDPRLIQIVDSFDEETGRHKKKKKKDCKSSKQRFVRKIFFLFKQRFHVNFPVCTKGGFKLQPPFRCNPWILLLKKPQAIKTRPSNHLRMHGTDIFT